MPLPVVSEAVMEVLDIDARRCRAHADLWLTAKAQALVSENPELTQYLVSAVFTAFRSDRDRNAALNIFAVCYSLLRAQHEADELNAQFSEAPKSGAADSE